MDDSAMQAAIQSGQIAHNTLVFKAGETEWKQARDFPEIVAMHNGHTSSTDDMPQKTYNRPEAQTLNDYSPPSRPQANNTSRWPENDSAKAKLSPAFDDSAQTAYPKTSKVAQGKPYEGLKFYHWIAFAFSIVACIFFGVPNDPEFTVWLLRNWIFLWFTPTSYFLLLGHGDHPLIIVLVFILCITGMIGLRILFRKRGIPEYNIFIPIVGMDRLLHTIGLSRWCFLLLYLPWIGNVFGFICVLRLIQLATKATTVRTVFAFFGLFFFSGLYLLDAGIKVRKSEKRSTIQLYLIGALLTIIIGCLLVPISGIFLSRVMDAQDYNHESNVQHPTSATIADDFDYIADEAVRNVNKSKYERALATQESRLRIVAEILRIARGESDRVSIEELDGMLSRPREFVPRLNELGVPQLPENIMNKLKDALYRMGKVEYEIFQNSGGHATNEFLEKLIKNMSEKQESLWAKMVENPHRMSVEEYLSLTIDYMQEGL